MQVLAVSNLPVAPNAAAATFYADYLPRAQTSLMADEACLVIAFDAADYTHTAWRLAAVQMLAREHAPARINAISGGGVAARAAALAYLVDGAGITGQYLPLDDAGAVSVVSVAP